MDFDIVNKLYFIEGMSAQEIAVKLNKTVWQVIRFMKKNKLERRRASETLKLQFEKKPLSFQKKLNLTNDEKMLHIAGHMLYWAEGTKYGDHVVDFVNSDVDMILLFTKMLRTIYGVTESRLRVLLYCYANQNPTKLILFWSGKLRISKKQFIKPYVRKDYNPSKINKMPYGVVHVRYNDKKLFMKIKEEIDIMKNSF